ncbi:MAG: histidine kinase [Chitinophagaceae bacterium]|nr:histidine kinase [Chitinophagaceae bacterium]
MDLNDFKEAQKWQDTCLYYAEKYEGRTPATLALYGEATKLFEQAGNLPRALQMMRIYDKIKDSVFKLQRLEKINELEQKYNKATNERTIRELDQQRSIYILLSLAGLLAVIVIAFFFRQQSLKQKHTILETEQRLNRARMNPHFFFNSLTALQKFALQENNGAAMASNLSRFSNIMRETLESTYKEYVTIEDEMEFLTQYLEVQKVRFPKTFSYEVTAPDDLEVDELQLPSMIIQPFIENSIEHGFAGVDYPGKIEVAFSKQGEELLVRISDNGKGLNTESEKNNAHISRASQIIKDRLYLLNLKHKTKAQFTIENKAIGYGVEVVINLPLIYTDSK